VSDTTLIVHGKPFAHRDVNTMVKVADPMPNPVLVPKSSDFR
jgi:hypothetical protein